MTYRRGKRFKLTYPYIPLEPTLSTLTSPGGHPLVFYLFRFRRCRLIYPRIYTRPVLVEDVVDPRYLFLSISTITMYYQIHPSFDCTYCHFDQRASISYVGHPSEFSSHLIGVMMLIETLDHQNTNKIIAIDTTYINEAAHIRSDVINHSFPWNVRARSKPSLSDSNISKFACRFVSIDPPRVSSHYRSPWGTSRHLPW